MKTQWVTRYFQVSRKNLDWAWLDKNLPSAAVGSRGCKLSKWSYCQSDDGDDDDDDDGNDDVESYWDNKAECGSPNLGLVQYTRSPLYKVKCDEDHYLDEAFKKR